MRRLAILAAVAAAALALGSGSGATGGALAAGQPFFAANLKAGDGSGSWLPSSPPLSWTLGPDADSGTPEQVEYVLRRALEGTETARVQFPWSGSLIRLPIGAPGVYRAEVRLGANGTWGPWTGTIVRFDDTRPGAARPRVAPGWAANPVRVTIEPPPGPASPAGIRGYAVSIDSQPTGSPCLSKDRCTEDEIDTAGGSGEARVALDAVREGANYVHVVAVSGAGLRSTEVATARVDVDTTVPEVTLAGVPAGWARGPVRVQATARDRLAGMGASGPAQPFTAIGVDGGVATIAAGDSVATTIGGSGTHRVEFYARDAAGNVGDGKAGSPPPREELVRIDSEPPRVRFRAGPDPADPERLEALVEDRLSGPAAGGSIAVRRHRGEGAFTPLPTSASAGRLVARWDSDSVAAGTYEFRATAFDRAGNVARGSLRTDGARMVLASRLKRRVAVRFGFGGKRLFLRRCKGSSARRQCQRRAIEAFDRRPARRVLPHGRPIPVSGILTGPDARPLRARRVTVVESLASGTLRTTRLRTNAHGAFATRLAAGPSRVVEARFGGDRVLSRARGKRLQLTVRTGVRLRGGPAAVAIGGAPARFSGRVAGERASIPPEGLTVELQFRLPGLPWTEFRTVRTDRRGRFRHDYAFSDDDSRGIRFLFRAHVPGQAAWPYAAGSSLPVAITGR